MEDDDEGDFCEIGDGDDSFVIQGAITDDRVMGSKPKQDIMSQSRLHAGVE